MSRCVDAHAYAAPIDFNNADRNIITNANLLTFFSGEYKHVPSLA
jgi:hypothetical protein